ncbi:DUF2339 domain-containing protein [Sphingosinicella sp. YJ22]|uniref:DUF2339 domain-containing protein n=1 Tax=Sphingosinicella sp. YJ22 TaxID=1104780 RepID=UPI00140A8A8F|nr:DUF2339 domain-containing protein [Sphingosinicella sp. YJ22]
MFELLAGLSVINLLGLVGLFIWNQALAARVEELERRIGERGAGSESIPVPAQPAQEPTEPFRPATASPLPLSFANLFEGLIGGRLLIWVGAVALVTAAIFLIRFAIEVGLITPELRMVAAAAFGVALLALGEGARLTNRWIDDPRISQALVGAGLAVLYATVYGSYFLYGFIGLETASVLMLAITVAALGLSLRHGAGTAALGLIGGFLTPWLVGDPDTDKLLLLAYLALLDAAVFAIAWRRGWGWLAGVAVLASFGWAAWMLFGEARDAVAAGWFILLLALIAGWVRAAGASLPWLQPLAIAAVLLAVLTARDDVGGMGWLLFGAVAAAAILFARLHGHPPLLPFGVMALGLLLIPVKSLMDDDLWLAAAAAGLTLLFGGGGLALAIERNSRSWAALACAGFAGPVTIMRAVEPERLSVSGWGLLLALLAAGPALLIWSRSRDGRPHHQVDLPALIPATTAAALLAFAAADLVAWEALSIAWLVLSIAFISAGMALKERTTRVAGLVLLTLTVLKLFLLDAAALEGVLRILSFFGLGAALIVLGRFYGTLLRAERAG